MQYVYKSNKPHVERLEAHKDLYIELSTYLHMLRLKNVIIDWFKRVDVPKLVRIMHEERKFYNKLHEFKSRGDLDGISWCDLTEIVTSRKHMPLWFNYNKSLSLAHNQIKENITTFFDNIYHFTTMDSFILESNEFESLRFAIRTLDLKPEHAEEVASQIEVSYLRCFGYLI